MTREGIQQDKAFDRRVCHIISSFRPLMGGAERATENLCRELARLGADVVVLTRHHRGLPRHERIGGVPVHRLGLAGPKVLSSATFIVHALWWMWLRLSCYPVVHVQNIDSPLLIGMLAKALLHKKLAVTIHGEKQIAFEKDMPLGKWRVGLMIGLGDVFVALTEPCHHQYLEEGIAPDRIVDIPNGIDIEDFCPPTVGQKTTLRKQFGHGADDCVVLYAGRLVELKRVDLLIWAFVALPEAASARCLIVGAGPERENLEAQVRAKGLDARVHLVGATNDVLPFYQMADIFVLPSLYEGLSVALLEAMACGLCVIVAGSPGNLAVVEHGVDGLVFPVERPEVLVERLAEALANPERRRVMGQAARQRVALTHSIQTVARAHIEMYQRLLEG